VRFFRIRVVRRLTAITAAELGEILFRGNTTMKQARNVTGIGKRVRGAIIVLIASVFAMAQIGFAQTD
jgi:hypothetical protein